MKRLLILALLSCGSLATRASVVYTQPHDGSGSLYQSSVSGTDYDQMTWDRFALTNATAISEVHWRGGYIHGGTGGPVTNWTIAFYGDIANGYQPDIINPPLATYSIPDSAGESSAGAFGGAPMYDYSVALPSPFQAAAGQYYWLLIQANQHTIPDWGIALGSGGNGTCFRRVAGVGDWWYYLASGDTAFTLVASDSPTVVIDASASPVNAGIVLGAGAYPIGSTALLTARPNAGYGFVDWTENGSPVSASPSYNFPVASPRTLVANFVPAWTITTSASPGYGGSTAGGGIYNDGVSVTVSATPAAGYSFVNWTESGTPVSSLADYTFTAGVTRVLVANFTSAPATAVFDFDTGTPPLFPTEGMPSSQSNGGITAYFSALSGAWSIQNTFYGWVPSVFSGNFLYSSVSGGSVAVLFSQPVTNVSLAFFTGDIASEYDVATTVRISAYTNQAMTSPVAVGTAQGAWVSGAYPEGTMSLSSATPFDRITIDMPSGQGLVSYLLYLDNIVVQTVPLPPVAIATSASPPEGGATSGDGLFAPGTVVSVVATANPGYAFVNWTENGVEVSTAADYSSPATVDRVLVANFVPSVPTFSIVLSALPSNGGSVSGGGAFANGATAGIQATPNSGYAFVNWTENGAQVAALPSYSFPVNTNRVITAHFIQLPSLSLESSNGVIRISWATNGSYTLQRNTDLATTNWVNVLNGITTVGANQVFTETIPAAASFFRLATP